MHNRLGHISLQTAEEYERLVSAIHCSSSPEQIASACSLISSLLRPNSSSPDHSSRLFFSLAFPTLIQRLFSFHVPSPPPPNPPQSSAKSNGWIDSVIELNDSKLASLIFRLLSPDGVVVNSISVVDRLSLVEYVFPVERLPEWTRLLLSGECEPEVVQALFPLFGGNRLKESHRYDYDFGYSVRGFGSCKYQVHVNVFDYYMFWFAYYPVCKSNRENSEGVITARKSWKFRLEDWTSSIPSFTMISSSAGSVRGREQKLECDLYMRLLYAYLRSYVPVYDVDLEVFQPYRSSLLHYNKEHDESAMKRAEFLVNLFVNYWLVDNDFSPMSRSVTSSLGVRKFITASKDTPPAAGLGEVVKLLVKYLNLSVWNCLEANESMDSVKFFRSACVSVSWNTYLQRPLYRYLLRTLLFCPIGVSLRNVSEVVAVWACYLEPWSVGPEDFFELDAVIDGEKRRREGVKQKKGGYSSGWQEYVLSNYLYYSSLVMHFIAFAHKFLHVDAELIVQMVLKVLFILTSSTELLDLIKKVDALYHQKELGFEKSNLPALNRYVPTIREQLQDWEDGLIEIDSDGSFLREKWDKGLRLFSDGYDGGPHLFQLFVVRAEAELGAVPVNSLANIMDMLRDKVSLLFGGEILKCPSAVAEVDEPCQLRDGIFKPRRVGHNAFHGVKFKGDWMKRPVSEDEVAWLVKLLVQLSSWLNKAVGLHNAEARKEGDSPWPYIIVSGNISEVSGPLNMMKVVGCAVVSWLLTVAAAVAKLMRERGIRVNLRILASKRIVSIFLCLFVYFIMRRVFCSFWS
ncbi:hypothetical protein MLD38_038917 [Melastoma candidum]|uniref:Uncharacterized protein n=1 Tax=Melastoma candidum TaxID=119954 RepID=A0ACB9L0P5_9MYRT|nr:hypothetical protein MLD38_038917 [Melastoma candidum]